MIIKEIRVYAEVLEQGLDFCSYIRETGYEGRIVNIYTKKIHGEFSEHDSIVDRIRKVKDVDVLICAISAEEEYPLLMVEYSTAVPTDDHKMQRSDVYYWSANFRVPMMKISPADKGMDKKFGGGSKITDAHEQRIAFDRGALFYPIKWKKTVGSYVLPTKENALSCIPHSDEIKNILSTIFAVFSEKGNYIDFYKQLLDDYAIMFAEVLECTPTCAVKSNIVNSSRFHWYGDKLAVKINRFGHAMDPDRGILYFANMLVGTDKTITEIQVNRPSDIGSRGGYKALFDAIPRMSELTNYVSRIIENSNNIFSDENALHVFTYGLNIEKDIRFKETELHKYIIEDDVLEKFLVSHKSVVAKTIFFLSTELKLTDKNRDTICSIKWNEAPILRYLNSVSTSNRAPLQIKPLSFDKAKEDIITFASVELYKKLNYGLLAVSYPGAQGDRCILTGNGRTVLRTYVDIIAYKANNNGIRVFLEECKDEFSKSRSDVDKLKSIVDSTADRDGLKLLFKKTILRDDILDLFTSVAAKASHNIPSFCVDYIFMFSLSYDEQYTYIDYTVAIVNTSLVEEFIPLSNSGRLAGRMKFDRIYVIE